MAGRVELTVELFENSQLKDRVHEKFEGALLKRGSADVQLLRLQGPFFCHGPCTLERYDVFFDGFIMYSFYNYTIIQFNRDIEPGKKLVGFSVGKNP